MQAQILAWFEPADVAGQRVKDHMQAIAEGRSFDTVELALRAKRAAEAYESVKLSLYRLEEPKSEDLKEGLGYIRLAAVYREDAYRAIYSWVDSRKDTDVATYIENMEDANTLSLAGLALIIQVAGWE